jgi:hypothetical protein
VRFVKKLPVETIEIAEVMRVEFLSAEGLDPGGDAGALVTHMNRVKSKARSPKSKVAVATDACRIVALGAKTGEPAPIPRPLEVNERAYIRCQPALFWFTRHLAPALSPNSVGGEGETSAISLENPRLDWPDGLPIKQRRAKAVPSPGERRSG